MGWYHNETGEAVRSEDVDAFERTCNPQKYIIIHTHPGYQDNLGYTLRNSANTHKKEIENHTFPNLPEPPYTSSCDSIDMYHCNNVNEESGDISSEIEDFLRRLAEENVRYRYPSLIGEERDEKIQQTYEDYSRRPDPSNKERTRSLEEIISNQPDGSIKYLSIFAHSSNTSVFFHHLAGGWTNLDKYSVYILDPVKFSNPCQIRIFGCYAGFREPGYPKNICEFIAEQIPGSEVYGYGKRGGSMGTNDREIGHGRKPVPVSPPPDPRDGDTWYVTYSPGQKSTFNKFP